MDRRRYLRNTMVLSAPLLSGCASNHLFSSSGTAKLGDIKALNYDSRPHTLHILVKEDNELAHWSSHRLKPVEQEGHIVSLKNTWGDNNLQDTLYARRDTKSSWKKTTLSNLPEGTTYEIDVGIQKDKEITFAMSPVTED